MGLPTIALIISGLIIIYAGKILFILYQRRRELNLWKERRKHPNLDEEHSSDESSDIIPDARGRAEDLYDNIVFGIEERSVPDTIVEKRTGTYSNEFWPILTIRNKYCRTYEFLVLAVSYGEYLDVIWFYSWDTPDRFEAHGLACRVVDFLDKRDSKREGWIMNGDWTALALRNVDHWKNMVHHVILEEIVRMREEFKLDFSKEDDSTKGFINLS